MMKYLTQHLTDVNESYLDHMKIAVRMSCKMIYYSLTLLIHALLPFIFITTASDGIKKLNKFISEKNCTKNHNKKKKIKKSSASEQE